MNSYDYFINNDCTLISKDLGLNEINLKNLIEQSYHFYFLDLNIETIANLKENKKADKYFNYFHFSFIISGIIFVGLLFFFIYYIMTLYNIEIYFLDKLINFNSTNFDNYIKKLDEIKKKLRNDNTEEEEKGEDNDLKDEEEGGGEGNDIIEEKKTNETKGKVKTKKKDKNQKLKIQQQRRNKLNIMTTYFKIKVILFQIKIILILACSLTYYMISLYTNSKYKKELIDFYEINESLDKVFKDSYDIYLTLLRKLEIFESNLINCNTIKEDYEQMQIPKIGEIETPKFGNTIMEITGSSVFNKENVDRFSKLYDDNVCELIVEDSNLMVYCEKFWNGVLMKGLKQAIIQMDVILGTVLDELQSLNEKSNNMTLLGVMTKSSLLQYSEFTIYYLYYCFSENFSLFNEFRVQKLNSILKIIKLILFIYILVSLFLFILLIYFVYSYNSLFNTFLNFIGIFPSKYLYEDEIFFREIINFGEKYF